MPLPFKSSDTGALPPRLRFGVSNIQQKEQNMARNFKSNRKETREAKAPAFIAYYVEDKEDKSFWTRIGAAWDHEDGKGLTLQLDLVPVSGGRIVLRTPAETEEKGA
jgi:hypothetical protein